MELRSLETFETNGGGDPSHRWATRNRVNGCEGQPAGGCVTYAGPGSVHTSYLLLGANATDGGRKPPAGLYKSNPEWFWPRDSPDEYGPSSRNYVPRSPHVLS